MAAMQISANESMWPILASFKWTRSYWTAVATPITPRDLVVAKPPGWPRTSRWSVSSTRWSSRASASCTAPSPSCSPSWPRSRGSPTPRRSPRHCATQENPNPSSSSIGSASSRCSSSPAASTRSARCRAGSGSSSSSCRCTTASRSARTLALGRGPCSSPRTTCAVLLAFSAVGTVLCISELPSPPGGLMAATVLRVLPRGVRLPSLGAHARAQRDDLPQGLVLPRLGVLRAAFYLLSSASGSTTSSASSTSARRRVTYSAFVAPGMLATSAMNGSMTDATFNTFFRLKVDHTYDSVMATPLDRRGHRPRVSSPGA